MFVASREHGFLCPQVAENHVHIVPYEDFVTMPAISFNVQSRSNDLLDKPHRSRIFGPKDLNYHLPRKSFRLNFQSDQKIQTFGCSDWIFGMRVFRADLHVSGWISSNSGCFLQNSGRFSKNASTNSGKQSHDSGKKLRNWFFWCFFHVFCWLFRADFFFRLNFAVRTEFLDWMHSDLSYALRIS